MPTPGVQMDSVIGLTVGPTGAVTVSPEGGLMDQDLLLGYTKTICSTKAETAGSYTLVKHVNKKQKVLPVTSSREFDDSHSVQDPERLRLLHHLQLAAEGYDLSMFADATT